MKVVITGGTKGIGLALSREFLKAGDDICICSRNETNVTNALKILKDNYPNRQIVGTTCNMGDLQDVRDLGDFALNDFGSIDIWVNNAGTKGPQQAPLYELDEDAIRIPVNTNLIGVMFGCQVAIQIMMKQGFGKIYNMEGMGSNGMASPYSIGYGATKASLPQMLKTLKKELQGSEIIIGDISPGMVLTDLLIKDNAADLSSSFHKVVNILNIRKPGNYILALFYCSKTLFKVI